MKVPSREIPHVAVAAWQRGCSESLWSAASVVVELPEIGACVPADAGTVLQNVHLSVLEAFAPSGTAPHTALIEPGRFADAVMARRAGVNGGGTLAEIHVYRGMPSSDKQPTPAARNKAQAAQWTRDRRHRPRARIRNGP